MAGGTTTAGRTSLKFLPANERRYVRLHEQNDSSKSLTQSPQTWSSPQASGLNLKVLILPLKSLCTLPSAMSVTQALMTLMS